ncbi:helix-turn-helix domain-containing protein [Paenibacillus sp. KQZ6P-2]|uniref:Helix-turn-helix domain-containing protein n=1 Tax=Paenibacillus mangrovi TaxID=2931978 RepID=A0A9X1WLF3_9BACL|nr:helix-turn-helix domain-containing protein [Paenibacillus mangrovi]MCJ8011482.1 helix-turn-helix domain-containing protein [Paenibacillus mangrovi]
MKHLVTSFPRKATAQMKKKTLVAIFLRFFVLIVLLLISTSTIAVYSNYRMIDDAREANRNYLRAASSSLDGLLDKIKDQGYSIASDTSYLNLLSFTDKSQTHYASTAYLLSSKLYDLFVSDSAVDDSFIYFSKLNTILAGSGSYDPVFYLERNYHFRDYPLTFWDQQFKSGIVSSILPATDVYRQSGAAGEKKYKTIIPLVLNIESVIGSSSFMVVNIDEQKIYQMINNMNITKKGDIYLIDTLHNRIISSTDRDKLGDTFDIGALQINPSSGTSESEMLIHGDNNILSFHPSSWDNLGFLVVTPEKALTAPVYKFLYMTIGVIALFMLIGTAVSVVFSRGIYSPLAEMVHVVKRLAKAPFESGKSEYDYIKESITTWHQYQQETMPSLIQIFLYRALNQQLNKEDIERLSEKYDFFRGGGSLALAVVRFDFLRDHHQQAAELHQTLISLHKPLLDINSNEMVLFLQEQDDVGVTVFVTEELHPLLSRYEEDLVGEISLTVGISKIFNQLEYTQRAYKEATEILDLRSVGECGMIFNATTCAPGRTGVFFSSDMKETARKYLENGHVEGASELLDQLFEGARIQHMRFAVFRQFVSDLLYFAVETVYNRRMDEEGIFGMPASEMIAYVNSLHHPSRIEAACRTVFENVIAQVHSQQQSSQAITGMLDYISTHLAEVNLTSISEHFHMNTNYVSQYFKKHQGVTFTDYINRMRIEKAKELLMNTDHTATDIGRLVGFNNANAFIRMFKKLEGTTPNEYRKSARTIYNYSSMEG